MKRFFAALLVAVLCVISAVPHTAVQAAVSVPPAPAMDFPLFPENTTLTYFMRINGAMSATMSDYNSVAFFQELEKESNVHIEWIHPANGTAGSEQFALMVASSNLPDLINWPLDTATGGVAALLRDEIIIPISDEDARTYMPSYMHIMDNNQDYFQSTLLDDGTFFRVVNLNYDPINNEYTEFSIKGPMLRLDWVRAVGKKVPTTIDELYDVFTAIKNTDINGKGVGNSYPFMDSQSYQALKAIAGSFGTRWDMHMRDDKVVYGPTTPEFKEYLETMAKWYAEGLINSDFPVLESINPAFLNNEAGFTIGSMGSMLTVFRTTLKEVDPSYDLDAIPYPKGPQRYQSLIDDKWRNPNATAITSINKYPKESMVWLDYFYSPEGSIKSTFGVEGVSYEMVDGRPRLLSSIMRPNEEKGWNQEEHIARYSIGPINFPNARDVAFYEQVNLSTEWQQSIQPKWKTGTTDILMPPITLGTEDAAQYASVMADIKTYTDEMVLKFIIGQEPMANYEKFVENINGMGIDRAIAIQQAATNNYKAR